MTTVSNQVTKTRMKPEVIRIFEDLEQWLDHCRFNLLNFNPADLYKSREWKEFTGKSGKSGNDRRNYRRDKQSRA